MRKAVLALGIPALMIAVIIFAVIRREEATRRLRAELAALVRQRTDLTELRQENRDLAMKQISVEELARLRREHAEMERLRREIDGLKHHQSSGLSPTAGDNGTMVPAVDWKSAGKETPKTAFESVLWAATHQDIDSLASLLSFSAKTRAAADEFFAQLPDSVRTQYGSPEKIAATMLAANMPSGLSAMSELSENAKPDDATLLMGIQRSDGSEKETFFQFHRGADGWQLIVPASVMEGYGQQLGTSLPANQ
jgi:hypothetical protein